MSYMSVSAPKQLPGTVCVACSFPENSEAHWCYTEILNDGSVLEVFNTTRKEEQLSALHCATGLETGNYTVRVGEIECTGIQGPMAHVEWYNVSVVGLPSVQTSNMTSKKGST